VTAPNKIDVKSALDAITKKKPPAPRVPTPEEIRAYVDSDPGEESLSELWEQLSAALKAMPLPLLALNPLLEDELADAPPVPRDDGAESAGIMHTLRDRYGAESQAGGCGSGERLRQLDSAIRKVADERGWEIVESDVYTLDEMEAAAKRAAATRVPVKKPTQAEFAAAAASYNKPRWKSIRVPDGFAPIRALHNGDK
jgi:hypothetical protein